MHETFTAQPIEGDYILSFTGFSWNILRRTGHESAMSISAGDKNRKTALARIRSLTETDGADALQEISRLISWLTRFRKSAPPL